MYALLDDDQLDLRTLARSIAESIGLEQPADLDGIDRATGWKLLGDSGLLELRVHDPASGPPASGVEIMVIAEALGARLAPHPYVSTVLASELLSRADTTGKWMPKLSGEGREIALLLRPDLAGPASTGGFLWGSERAGIAVGYDSSSSEVIVLPIPADVDGNRSADLTQCLRNAPSPPPGSEVIASLPPTALAAWDSLAMVAICADTIGVLRQGLEDVVEYTKERIAFGVPVGSFQAVQHLAADMLVEIEAASAATSYAAWCIDAEESETALLAAHTAKALVASMAREAAETTMQIYGGIGQTWEHVAHLRTRRALLNTQLFGDESDHLDAIATARLGRI